MVCVNTHYTQLQFKHFVEIPSSDCVIGTAHDDKSKLKLFLIVNGDGPIYARNGLKSTWDKLDSETHNTVRRLVNDALAAGRVPRYSTCGLSVLN